MGYLLQQLLCEIFTPPKINNIAPEKSWLEDDTFLLVPGKLFNKRTIQLLGVFSKSPKDEWYWFGDTPVWMTSLEDPFKKHMMGITGLGSLEVWSINCRSNMIHPLTSPVRPPEANKRTLGHWKAVGGSGRSGGFPSRGSLKKGFWEKHAKDGLRKKECGTYLSNLFWSNLI